MFDKKIHTSRQVSNRMFEHIDADKDGIIQFFEFMEYISLLMNGAQNEKSFFIFQFISGKKNYFNKNDLVEVYKLINEENKNNNYDDEIEMANIIYYLMNKSHQENVEFREFVNFIDANPSNQDLFNFLSLDAEMSRKKIRVKKHNLVLLEQLELINDNIHELEEIIFPKKNGFSNKKMLFSNFQSMLASVKKNVNSQNEKLENYENLNINKNQILKIIKNIKSCTKNSTDILRNEIRREDEKDKLNLNMRNNNNKKITSTKNLRQQKVFLDNLNWEIVTTMVTGISKSINITKDERFHLITSKDFHIKNQIEVNSIFNKNFEICNFIDYAPYVFKTIRNLSGIDDEEFVSSIGVKTFQNAFFEDLYLMITEQSCGKSGSFFFYTSDNKYMIKTIKKDEFDALRNMLKDYLKFLQNNPFTLLTKYYGLYQLKCLENFTVVHDIYIVVMNNFFNMKENDLIKNKYDLKGSKYNRITNNEQVSKGATKKDLNFLNEKRKLFLDIHTKKTLLDQLEKDSLFLRQNDIIDYSLLLGIISSNELNVNSSTFEEIKNNKFVIFSNNNNFIYYLGIIDTLTNYGFNKGTEYVVKTIFQGNEISCVPPDKYQKRFVKFIESIITN